MNTIDFTKLTDEEVKFLASNLPTLVRMYPCCKNCNECAYDRVCWILTDLSDTANEEYARRDL